MRICKHPVDPIKVGDIVTVRRDKWPSAPIEICEIVKNNKTVITWETGLLERYFRRFV